MPLPVAAMGPLTPSTAETAKAGPGARAALPLPCGKQVAVAWKICYMPENHIRKLRQLASFRPWPVADLLQAPQRGMRLSL